MVRVDRIELTQPAWKAGVLPLNYTRDRIEWSNIDLILLRSSSFRGEFWIRQKEGKSDFQASDRFKANLSWSNMPFGGIEVSPMCELRG